MQLVFLEVLQQRAASTVHDALGQASGARGIQDEQRMVEGQSDELGAGARRTEPVPSDRARKCRGARIGRRIGSREERHHYDGADRGQRRERGRDRRQRVDALAGIDIAVGCEKHLGSDLSETVEDARDPEIGGAGRPHGADAGRGEHRDHRLGDVRQESGDAVAGLDARCTQSSGDPPHLCAKGSPTEHPAASW